MWRLENSEVIVGISERGEFCELINKAIRKNIIEVPSSCFKIIFREGRTVENIIDPTETVPVIERKNGGLELLYDKLYYRDCLLDIKIRVLITLYREETVWSIWIDNRDTVEIIEVWFPIIPGVKCLDGKNKPIYLILPYWGGVRIENPHLQDFFSLPFLNRRPYEGPDHIHQNICLLYPGLASMQWYELYTEDAGLYISSYDTSLQTTAINIQRDLSPEARENTLQLTFVKYPFLSPGESWKSEKFIVSPHRGDWHIGARKYREWFRNIWGKEEEPDWVKSFRGWLRCIFKHQSGRILHTYNELPILLSEAKTGGLDTVFILGWEPGGFSNKWPEYEFDPMLGGEEILKQSISEVHKDGGKVFFFVSYYLIDPETEFYKEIGNKISIKNIWGRETLFSETYPEDGTLLRVSENKPMVCACPSTKEWQETMVRAVEKLAKIGADGILLDIAGSSPVFCTDSSHPHIKPSYAFSNKERNFLEIRETIKRVNPQATLCMEHVVDVFGQHMGICQGCGPSSHPNRFAFPEMFRYTFPDYVITNRECGLDERDYLTNIGFSFLHQLRFDMSVFRCRGILSNLPRYAEYLRKLNRLTRAYSEFLLRGDYIDNENVIISSREGILGKGYSNGRKIAVVIWNPTEVSARVELEISGSKISTFETIYGKEKVNRGQVLLPPNSIGVALTE